MQPGFMSDLSNLDDVRKTAAIDNKLMRLKVDIATLQEMRLVNSSFVKEQHDTFRQGKLEQETRGHGVGFAVRNHLLQMITPPTEGTERMLTLCLSSDQGTANILCIYAPTMSASPETKDKFYEDFNTAVKNIPLNEFLLLLGDFNARVGSDRDIWPTCLGHHGFGNMNENGTMAHCSRKETLPHINTCYPRDLVKIGEFLDTLQHTLSQDDDHSRNAAELWGSKTSITYDTTIKVLGKRKRKNANWVEAFWLEMEPVIITAKRTALLNTNNAPLCKS